MKKVIDSQFERIGKLVEASGLPEDEMRLTVECLRKLPALCETFCQSYESRDVERILRMERQLLARLGAPDQPSEHARELAKALGTQLKNLHERLGLPEIEPKPAPRPVKASPRGR